MPCNRQPATGTVTRTAQTLVKLDDIQAEINAPQDDEMDEDVERSGNQRHHTHFIADEKPAFPENIIIRNFLKYRMAESRSDNYNYNFVVPIYAS